MSDDTICVGLDVHACSITVALSSSWRSTRIVATVPNAAKSVLKALEKDGQELGRLVCCYEAGPTGYGLQRELEDAGVACIVVAPSLIPTAPGRRVKTDRRDAANLAHLLRAGMLTEVHVPDEATEAMRDLERARDDAKKAQRVTRQNLSAFLLRRGRRFSGKARWTKAHLEWIRKQVLSDEASRRTLEDYLDAVLRAGERVERLTNDIRELVESWALAPMVKALQGFRGIDLVTAVTIMAELGDLKRFRSAPQLMSYLGLTPSEHSSGNQRRQGGITKSGNGHVRRVLVESAWSYRFRPRTSPAIRKRQEGLSDPVLKLATKAQSRLCRKYQRMSGQGKKHQVTVTAIARELAGFIWAVGQQPQLLAA